MSGGEPRRLGEDLDRVVAGLGVEPHRASRPVEAASRGAAGLFTRWEALVGAELAAHARLVGMRDGCLVVAVDDPAWAAEVRWLTQDLLARIAADGGPQLADIRVRVVPRRG